LKTFGFQGFLLFWRTILRDSNVWFFFLG